MATSSDIVFSLGPEEGLVWTIVAAPKGEIVACAHSDGSISLFDVSKRCLRHRLVAPQLTQVSLMSFSPDSDQLAVSYDGGAFRVHDVGTGDVVFHSDEVWGGEVAWGRQLIALVGSQAGTLDPSAHFAPTQWGGWDADTLSWPTVIAWSPDGRLLAVGSADCEGVPDAIYIFDATTQHLVHRQCEGVPDGYDLRDRLVFTSNDSLMWNSSHGLWQWRLSTGICSRLLGPIGIVAFSHDGRWGACELRGTPSLVLYDINGDRQVAEILHDTDGFTATAFSPTADYVVVASFDHIHVRMLSNLVST